jgi:hypothetical protein
MRTQSGGKLKSNRAPHVICGQLGRMLLLSALVVCGVSADVTIDFQVTTSGATGAYQYFVSGFTAMQPCGSMLGCSNEIDIDFDASLFSAISNGVAPAGFSLLLFQPNNPPQAPGDYSALAVVANPASSPFSVDFTLTGAGMSVCSSASPQGCAQTFNINEFANTMTAGGEICYGCGMFEGTVQGPELTTPLVSAVPEPASVWLVGAVIIIVGIFLRSRFLRLYGPGKH